MKKDVSVTYHLENIDEFRDLISHEINPDRMYFIYPTFWYDNDINRPYLSFCITVEPNAFSNCLTIFPPECENTFDLHIQLASMLQDIKDLKLNCALQKLDYKDA